VLYPPDVLERACCSEWGSQTALHQLTRVEGVRRDTAIRSSGLFHVLAVHWTPFGGVYTRRGGDAVDGGGRGGGTMAVGVQFCARERLRMGGGLLGVGEKDWDGGGNMSNSGGITLLVGNRGR
jgi:hypothetical protein